MVNSVPNRSRPAHEAPAGVAVRTDRLIGGQTARRFGPREQHSLLEATYGLPEPEAAEYSGVVKVAILVVGSIAGWGVIIGLVMAARFLGGF